MGESEMIDEIKSLPKPSNFEQVRVDGVLAKYFEKGMSREDVDSALNKFGFAVSSQMKDVSDPEFANCEESILVGVYELKKMFSPVASYRVVVYFGFEKNSSSAMKGFYIKNMF